MKETVIKAYVEGLQFVWLIMCVLAALAFVASLLGTKEISLGRELETEQGFIHNNKSRYSDTKGNGGKVSLVDEENAWSCR